MKEEIHIVDFSRAANVAFESNNEEDLTEIGKEIVKCFENIGFVYLKNHGIPQEQINNMFKLMDEFFNLPYDVKKKYAMKSLYSSGYVEPSKEIFNKSEHVKELRESYDVYPNFKECVAPNEIEGFEGSIQQTLGMIKELLDKLLRCLEIGLDLPLSTFFNIHTNLCSESNPSVLRLLHYPPIPFDVPENCARCGTHTDYGTVTFLFQDTIGGLEVKNRNNEWVQANLVPGTILVNVGDMLQAFTSGRLIATPHRVLIPEEEKRKKCSRKSVAFFVMPDSDVVIKPFESSPKDNKKFYRTCHDHLHSKLSSTFNFENQTQKQASNDV